MTGVKQVNHIAMCGAAALNLYSDSHQNLDINVYLRLPTPNKKQDVSQNPLFRLKTRFSTHASQNPLFGSNLLIRSRDFPFDFINLNSKQTSRESKVYLGKSGLTHGGLMGGRWVFHGLLMGFYGWLMGFYGLLMGFYGRSMGCSRACRNAGSDLFMGYRPAKKERQMFGLGQSRNLVEHDRESRESWKVRTWSQNPVFGAKPGFSTCHVSKPDFRVTSRLF